jgi:hypothetical protein
MNRRSNSGKCKNNKTINNRNNYRVTNDRQYDQSILRVPKQKLTLYGTGTFQATTDALSIVFTLLDLSTRIKGFTEIFGVHNNVKPLGLTVRIGPIDPSNKLTGQVSRVTTTKFNGAKVSSVLASSTKIMLDTGGTTVYIWPTVNRAWTDTVASTHGGVILSAQGYKQNTPLFEFVLALTVVFD